MWQEARFEGTPSRSFTRHYWVLAKLVLTVFATGVLLLQMNLLSQLADATAKAPFGADLDGLRRSPVLHAGGSLLVLLLPLALSMYKPGGMTRYSWRQQRAGRPPRGE